MDLEDNQRIRILVYFLLAAILIYATFRVFGETEPARVYSSIK
jgi:hypothetical protein